MNIYGLMLAVTDAHRAASVSYGFPARIIDLLHRFVLDATYII